MRKVLLLGAGLVSGPLARHILGKRGIELTVASLEFGKIKAILEGRKNAKAVSLDITKDKGKLERLVKGADLVVSLLPAARHVEAADFCIRHRKPLVTTSYASPEMKKRDAKAREAGILLLNEIGLDPGIDHMSAMKIIRDVAGRGGKIVSFKSYCGGLPAPEANTNPFGYKFSWSPRGVLMAAKNAARYIEDGRTVEVRSEDLLAAYHMVGIKGAGMFEAYPNRDSLPYVDLYGLRDCRAMSRWTLRNISHCGAWKEMIDLGLFSDERVVLEGMTYSGLVLKLCGAGAGAHPREAVRRKLNLPAWSVTLRKLEWLGLFDDAPIPGGLGSPLEVIEDLMMKRMSYEEGERDMVVLHHELIAEYPAGKERITSTLVERGIPGGDSAMARTVGLPAAIAALLILEGRIKAKGVAIPNLPSIYDPVLDGLARLGIACREEEERIG